VKLRFTRGSIPTNADEQAAVEAGEPPLRARLRRLPKAELHVHLDGSVRAETLLELGAAYGMPMPADSGASLREFMHVRDARNLVDYLKLFDVTLSVMQTEESLERIAFELAEDLANEAVRYAEIRYSPVLSTREGLSLEAAVEAPLRGLARARDERGIICRLIICAIRSMPPDIGVGLAELAVDYQGRGVVGFDLAGPEAGFPATLHLEAFRIARRSGLPITVHAGEAAGPESIRQAIEECGAGRIGHGTRLVEDPELLRFVRHARVPLEICLTSNVQTHAVESYESHPLRRFQEEGLVMSLNTDNRLMSRTTVTEEYWRAHLHLGFTWKELTAIARMSLESSFLESEEKRRLLPAVQIAIAEMEREAF
jgi:adenosine deaminase